LNQLEQKTITSLEVAEMVDKDHKELLRDVRRYSEQLAGSKIALGDFFTESTYKDANQQDRPCYLVTKKGCEFIGNKLTGTKGAIFTAKYINRFHEMEEAIQKPKSPMELLQLEFEAIKEVTAKVEAVDQDLQAFKMDLPLLALECQRITRAKNQKVVPLMGGKNAPAYKDNGLRGRVYRDLEQQLNREFGVDTYKAIKRSQCEHALMIIDSYRLPMTLADEIHDCNAQMVM
jgi:Rha family phage regulatory protein